MDELLQVLNNPYAMFVVVLLTLASTFYCWNGFRQKDVGFILLGLGLGVPTFSILNWHYWLVGIVVSAAGLWIRKQLS